jgi:hypothetical protein
LVLRYPTWEADDALPAGEGAFLPCTFWLVDCLALIGHREEAVELFERLLGLTNDVGLLSEEYDPGAKRLVGNFPQAFSHIGLVNSALNLTRAAPGAPARERAEGEEPAAPGTGQADRRAPAPSARSARGLPDQAPGPRRRSRRTSAAERPPRWGR